MIFLPNLRSCTITGNRSDATEINANCTNKCILMNPINVIKTNEFILGPRELFCDVLTERAVRNLEQEEGE